MKNQESLELNEHNWIKYVQSGKIKWNCYSIG